MKVEMQFFAYFFSASAKKVSELKIRSILLDLMWEGDLKYFPQIFSHNFLNFEVAL